LITEVISVSDAETETETDAGIGNQENPQQYLGFVYDVVLPHPRGGGIVVKLDHLATRLVPTLFALVALSACGSKPVVGLLLATSGPAASYGQAMKEGIDLALEQATNAGTLDPAVQFLWADSGTDPERAVLELRKLSAGGARLVIVGTTSDEAKALLPVLAETNTLALSPSASAPSLTKDSKLFFRVFASDELEGRRAGRFLREDQDRATTLIYAEDSEQARGIEPPFRQVFEQAMDGKVVGKVSLTDPDWQQQSADLLAANNPESVYIIGYAEGSLEVLRQLRDKAFEGTICLTSAFYSGEVIDQHPELVEGIFFPQPAFDMQDERDLVQDFVTAFNDKYGHDPDIYAAHAYDAARVVVQVINEVSVYETSELKKAMQFSLGEFPGVTGIVQFNDYGDVHHNPIMFTIREGEVLNYERYVKEQKKLIRDRIRRLFNKR
jgi:branched-chain amino acid transport system substrate-binding protein